MEQTLPLEGAVKRYLMDLVGGADSFSFGPALAASIAGSAPNTAAFSLLVAGAEKRELSMRIELRCGGASN